MPDRTSTLVASLAVVVVVVIFIGAPVIGEVQDRAGPEPPEYRTDFDCEDHTARSGEHIHSCNAQVYLTTLGDASYLEVRAIDVFSYETKTWTIYAESPTAYVWANRDGGGKLGYGDRIIVSAVYADGSVEVLERHEFSCEDVGYKDACER